MSDLSLQCKSKTEYKLRPPDEYCPLTIETQTNGGLMTRIVKYAAYTLNIAVKTIYYWTERVHPLNSGIKGDVTYVQYWDVCDRRRLWVETLYNWFNGAI